MTETILQSTVFYSLALTLLHFLWQGLLIAFGLKLLLLSIAHTKPQLRYGLSTLAMLLSLLLPLFTFLIIYPQEGMPLDSTISQATNIQTLTQQMSFFNYTFFNYKGFVESLPSTVYSALPYLSVLWLISVITLSIKLLIEIYNVNQLPKSGSLQPKPELLVRFNALVKKIGLTKAPLLLISLKAEVPMAIGWLKPIVLLPVSMLTSLNSAQLEMLILHELAHIRRHDYLVNFLQTLIEILLFFHPAVAWISKQMRNEREYCSDDIAVHYCGDPIAYAHTLTDTAALLCAKHPLHQTIPVMAMTASGGDLKQRVVRLVNHHCSSNNNISKWFAASSIIFALILVLSQQLLIQPILSLWKTHPSWQQNFTSSFNSKTNKLMINALAVNKADPFFEGSIAQQLLLTENSNKTANINSIKEIFIQNLQAQTNTQTAINAVTILVPKQIEPLKKVVAQSKTSRPISFQVTHTDNKKIEFIQNKQTKYPISKKIIEPLFVTHPLISAETSTVELAFKRTDSTNSLSSNKNPYAEQIAQLSNEQTILPVLYTATQLKSIDPVYPNMAKRKGIEIEVKVNFTIDINGQIKNIQFTPQSKINYFKRSILTAIKQWRFSPARLGIKPIESQMSKIFFFSLKNA